jgi:hypothetical protein
MIPKAKSYATTAKRTGNTDTGSLTTKAAVGAVL